MDPGSRVSSFERSLLVGGALDARSFPWGFAARTPSGWTVVVAGADEVAVADVLDAVPDAAVIECAEPVRGLVDRGWAHSVDLVMAHDGGPLSPMAIPVVRPDGPSMDAAWAPAWQRARPWLSDADALALAVETRAFHERACDEVGFHGVEVGGALVSRCECFRIGEVAQVDAVMTDPPHGGQGYATAVVLDAVAWARDRGAGLVFLRTDAAGRPQQLYRRLGFDDVGVVHAFRPS